MSSNNFFHRVAKHTSNQHGINGSTPLEPNTFNNITLCNYQEISLIEWWIKQSLHLPQYTVLNPLPTGHVYASYALFTRLVPVPCEFLRLKWANCKL